MTTATADTTAGGVAVRWDLIAFTTEREQQIVAHLAHAYPRLGETAIAELYSRVAESAARPVDQPGSWQGDSLDGFERWLRLRVNAACLAELGRPGLSRYVRATDTLDDLADQLGANDTHDELEARDVWKHLAPQLHEQERRYLMALTVCDSAAEAREHLGWSPRQWRRWQESCNSRLKQLHANGMLGVLPLPLLARIWATITPERVAAATATGGATAGTSSTLLGGAGAAKLVTGVAAIAAAGAGVITAEHHREKPKPKPVIERTVAPPVTPITRTASRPTPTTVQASKTLRSSTTQQRPKLATKKTATTDFKPAGGTAQKTRGGSSDFIPDGPTPVTKTYTPGATPAASSGGGQDFATP